MSTQFWVNTNFLWTPALCLSLPPQMRVAKSPPRSSKRMRAEASVDMPSVSWLAFLNHAKGGFLENDQWLLKTQAAHFLTTRGWLGLSQNCYGHDGDNIGDYDWHADDAGLMILAIMVMLMT